MRHIMLVRTSLSFSNINESKEIRDLIFTEREGDITLLSLMIELSFTDNNFE